MSGRALQACLASSSPQRRLLLEAVGVELTLCPVDVDETRLADEPAADYVARLAVAKAEAGAAQCGTRYPVIGADTVIVRDAGVLGKPADLKAARAMLESLSSRVHEAITGVAVLSDQMQARVVRTRVCMRRLSGAELDAYCATGEPLGRAGGYAIQGLGGLLVSRVEGSYANVVGLPLRETLMLLGGPSRGQAAR